MPSVVDIIFFKMIILLLTVVQQLSGSVIFNTNLFKIISLYCARKDMLFIIGPMLCCFLRVGKECNRLSADETVFNSYLRRIICYNGFSGFLINFFNDCK